MSSSVVPERRPPCLGILPEQLGYVQCSFCTTILLVSVPPCGGGGLQLQTVAVQCGNCSGVQSVTLPPQSTPVVELPLHEPPPRESVDESSGEDRELEAEPESVVFPVVNKPPPVRRKRTPSAYNCFVKEEITRIKERNPSITHKQAFSAASKNWAHSPRVQQKGKRGT